MLHANEIRTREQRRRRREPLWSLLSFLLHTGFFAALVWLTPVKELLVEPKEKPVRNAAEDLSADRLQDIGETLSDVRANELLKEVQDLQAVLHNMDLMKEALAQDYDRFAEKNAADAKVELEKLIDEAEEAQRKSVAAQEVVKNEVRELVRLETQEDLTHQDVKNDLVQKFDKLQKETVEQTNTAQANAVNAFDKLQTKAEFAALKKTSEAAEKFREAQIEVARVQDSAQTVAIEIASQMARIADNAKWIAEHEKAIANAEAKKVAAEEAKAQATEKREIAKQERIIAQAERDIKWRQERVKPDYARRDELEKQRQERANEQQVVELEKSTAAQRKLNEQIAVLKETLKNDRSEREKLAQAEQRQENALVREQAREKAMAEAYDLAVKLEQAVAESFKDVKALETALAKKMSFAAAAKMTDVVKPERKAVDRQLLEEKVRTKAALDRQKAAQLEAVRETEAMAENAKAMMEKAMEIVWKDQASQAVAANEARQEVRWLEEKDFDARRETVEARMAELDASADYQIELAEAASEDNQQKAKDLADLMKGEDGSIDQKSAKGSTEGANPGPPELKASDLGLVPGNVMAVTGDGEKGLPAKWMYVNSWHVIGPFPNPNRANLRRKFAPESKVDLDATYAGKDGKVLRWEYQQAKSSKPPQPWMADWHAEVVPEKSEEYAIFYAYAEVFFDAACDRWIAIGSDDRSDVWINDVPVWGSSNRLKAWTLAEDFRRVHFKKGRNRILARIENGHWNFGWSLCISTGDEK